MSDQDQYWADACSAAQRAEASESTRPVLYGTHGFTIACFVLGSVFSGVWLYRLWRVKKSNPGLLLSAWRFTGRFLCLSFACCVSGAAAWVSKMSLVYSNTELQFSATDDTDGATISCQRYMSLTIGATRSQSAFRIFYSIEFGCLFLSILLGLDRISEQALSTRALSSANQQHTAAAQPQRYTSMNGRPSETSAGQSPTMFSKVRLLPLVFKTGLALVLLCSVAAAIAVLTAASYGAELVTRFERERDACLPDGSFGNATQTADQGPLTRAIYAGHLSEFCAACVVIVLYVAVGLMGYSIVSSARKKIEASLAKLRQVQASIGSQHEAQAAVAGAARNAKQLRLCAAGRC